MQSLAIVSSYKEPCGVAFYSSRLVEHLKRTPYRVEVLRLPISLLRFRAPRAVRRKGDAAIARIASEAANFDAVLLQMEPGLYGGTPWHAYTRMRRILERAKKAVVTVHGFDRVGHAGNLRRVITDQFLFGRNISKVGWSSFSASRAASRFWRYVAESKHIRVLTTCAADAEMIRLLHDVQSIDHYPVTFYSSEEVAKIKASVDREETLSRLGLDPQKRHVGIFGFVSSYKGHLAAIRSLELLPANWELSVVGGEHPESLTAGRDIGSYVQQILAFSSLDPPAGTNDWARTRLRATFRRLIGEELMPWRSHYKYLLPDRDLRSRVHFVGQPSDDELPRLYAAFDYAVHPYMRTSSGQSGSGIAAMALEFGIRAVFSNAPVFREIEKYYRGALPFFNVGNFVELAEALLRYENFEARIRERREEALQKYNPDGMIEKYLEALA
jgi:glycosyltransferase involved in cell wall biosynthesis